MNLHFELVMATQTQQKPKLVLKPKSKSRSVRLSIKPKSSKSSQKAYPSDMQNLIYLTLARELQFLDYPLHIPNNLALPSNTKKVMKHMRLIQQTIVQLCHWNASVYVRVTEKHMGYMEFLMTGPKDTPYQNGLYHFSWIFPDDYPMSPPTVEILNTKRGYYRHNPNLYSSGKVCISILNTWSGGAPWTPSSVPTDVLLGIQTDILNEYPYRNEPAFAKATINICKIYNTIVQLNTMMEAMYDMVQNPPSGFEDVVTTHFFGPKKQEILQQLERWEQEALELDSITDIQKSVSSYMKSSTRYREGESFYSQTKRYADLLRGIYVE